jgi:oxalate decarboxylase/phosphoglucose isomerase-like protein (cupin superfamily)
VATPRTASGRGTCTLYHEGGDAEDIAFGPDSTLIVPAGLVHRIRNTGGEPIRLLATFNATPAAVLTPEGHAMTLPWSQLG